MIICYAIVDFEQQEARILARVLKIFARVFEFFGTFFTYARICFANARVFILLLFLKYKSLRTFIFCSTRFARALLDFSLLLLII